MPSWTEKTFVRLRIGVPALSAPPSALRVSVASVLSVVVSVAANAAIVRWATSEFPSTKNYSHFRFVDYATLTAVGVVAASCAWFVTTRVTTAPRWFFFRLAVLVMLVLWIPDVYLFIHHEPTSSVFFLMLMHLAVALITYSALVYLAPLSIQSLVASAELESNGVSPRELLSKGAWTSMMLLVGLEMLLGFGELLSVPFDRPNGWVIRQGEAITLLHGAVGGVLGFGAVAIYFLASRDERIDRIGAVVGLVGVAIGAVGGFCCYAHSLRLVGMVLMFLGGSTAFFGYLMPTLDDAPQTSYAQPSKG